MRKFLAIFFLLLFSIQALPVKAIGRALSKCQKSEEVKDSSADADSTDDYDSNNNLQMSSMISPAPTALFANSNAAVTITSSALSMDDLPPAHKREIHSPPPGALC